MGSKDIEIRKVEFVTKTQFLSENSKWIKYEIMIFLLKIYQVCPENILTSYNLENILSMKSILWEKNCNEGG